MQLKFDWSSVCLYRLLSTTRAIASRLRTTTRVSEFGDLQSKVVWVHLVRQLRDDQTGAVLGVFLDVDDGAHRDRTAARSVRLFDAVGAHDERAHREVGTLDAFE